MRENRLYSSEGGAGIKSLFLPLSLESGWRKVGRVTPCAPAAAVLLDGVPSPRLRGGQGTARPSALGSEHVQEGESPSLVELNASN